MEEKEIVFKSSSPKFKDAPGTKDKQKVSERLWLANYGTQCWKDNITLTQS